MDRMTKKLIVTFACVMALAVAASGCDWTQYGFDAGHGGQNPVESKLGAATVCGHGVAVVPTDRWAGVGRVAARGGGVVYAGAGDYPATSWFGSGRLFAFDAATGSGQRLDQLDLVPYIGAVTDPVRGVTPAISQGVMYTQTIVGTVEAVNLSTRAVLWSRANAFWGGTAPIVDGSTLIINDQQRCRRVGHHDGRDQMDGPAAPTRLTNPRLRAASCSRRASMVSRTTCWPSTRPPECSGGRCRSAPRPRRWLVGGLVYVSGSHGIAALDAVSGAIRWLQTATAFVGAGPSVGNGVVVVPRAATTLPAPTAGLSAFDAATGAPRWSVNLPADVTSKPSIANGVVYEGGLDAHLYAVDAATGSVLASPTAPGAISTSPTVANGMVYVGSEDGTLSAFGVPATGAQLNLSPGVATFADTFAGTTSAPRAFTLTNRGTAPASGITVAKFGTDAGQFAITHNACANTTLAPGATCEVDAAFTPSTEGPHSAGLVVTAAGKSVSSLITGTALSNGDHPILLSAEGGSPARENTFIGAIAGDSTVYTFTVTDIRASGSGPLAVSFTHADEPTPYPLTIVADHCTGTSLAAGATCQVVVRFAPPSGSVNGWSARFTVTPATGDAVGTVIIANPGAPLVATPYVGHYGSVATGTQSSLSFTITNQSAHDVPPKVTVLSPVNGDFTMRTDTCNGTTLHAGATCVVQVKFHAARARCRVRVRPGALGTSLDGIRDRTRRYRYVRTSR